MVGRGRGVQAGMAQRVVALRLLFGVVLASTSLAAWGMPATQKLAIRSGAERGGIEVRGLFLLA